MRDLQFSHFPAVGGQWERLRQCAPGHFARVLRLRQLELVGGHRPVEPRHSSEQEWSWDVPQHVRRERPSAPPPPPELPAGGQRPPSPPPPPEGLRSKCRKSRRKASLQRNSDWQKSCWGPWRRMKKHGRQRPKTNEKDKEEDLAETKPSFCIHVQCCWDEVLLPGQQSGREWPCRTWR